MKNSDQSHKKGCHGNKYLVRSFFIVDDVQDINNYNNESQNMTSYQQFKMCQCKIYFSSFGGDVLT